MAFKSVDQFNEERFGKFFMLRNDKDYADVIFLYQDKSECLIADTHYLKSANYNGYVHCCGNGCPACQKGIRVQTKLFIPLFNLNTNQIEFWDRTPRFEPQLQNDVFSKFPNPSEFIFRITRNGAAGDVNTTYSITPVAKNTVKSYAQILVENNAQMPDYYSVVCKELSAFEMQSMLVDTDKPLGEYTGASAGAAAYGAVPRGASSMPTTIPEPPAVSMPEYSAPPETIPGMPTTTPEPGQAEYESLPAYDPSVAVPTGPAVAEEPVAPAPEESNPQGQPEELDEEPNF